MARLIHELDTGVLRVPPALRAQIEAAFAHRVPPDGAHIVRRPDHCGDCRSVYTMLRGRAWRHVEVESIRREREGIFLLLPDGLAYYLPAFLLVAVSGDRSQPDPAEALEYLFSRRCREGSPDAAARLAALRPAELTAIAATLRVTAAEKVAAGGDDAELRETIADLEDRGRAGAALADPG
jgi:hypothetical protein